MPDRLDWPASGGKIMPAALHSVSVAAVITRMLRHGVSLAGRAGQPLHPDQREFDGVRWWTVQELRQSGLDGFEPHMLRALDALGLGVRK